MAKEAEDQVTDQPEELDDFEAAFGAAVSGGDDAEGTESAEGEAPDGDGVDQETDTTASDGDEEGGDDGAEGTDVAADAGGGDGSDGAADDPAGDKGAESADKPTGLTLTRQQVADMIKQHRKPAEGEGEKTPAQAPTQTPAQQQVRGTPEQQSVDTSEYLRYKEAKDFLTEADNGAIEKARDYFGEEFDGIQAMVDAQVKAVRHNLVAELAQTLTPFVAEVARMQQMSYGSQTLDEGLSAVIPDVVAWASKLPGKMAQEALSVVEQGTPEEIQQLVSVYKEATGTASAASPTPASRPKPSAPKPGAVAATTKSRTSRGEQGMNSRDQNDLQGAFNEAINS